MTQYAALAQRCQKDMVLDFVKAKDTCAYMSTYMSNMDAGVLDYNLRIFSNQDWSPIENSVINYLNTTALYKTIHIDQSTKSPIYNWDSDSVDKGYASDNLLDYSWYYDYLITNNFPLIVLAGEFDARDGAKS